MDKMGIDRIMELKENLFKKIKENEDFQILKESFGVAILRYEELSLDIVANKKGDKYILLFPNNRSEVDIYKTKKCINKLIGNF